MDTVKCTVSSVKIAVIHKHCAHEKSGADNEAVSVNSVAWYGTTKVRGVWLWCRVGSRRLAWTCWLRLVLWICENSQCVVRCVGVWR